MTTITGAIQAKASLTTAEKRKILVLICSVLLFSVMNGTMFLIAVPDIAQSFSLMPSQVSWVVTGYIIVYAIGALMYGKLADIYSMKKLLTIGLSLFAAGSILGFIAPTFLLIVFSRMIQAAGASAILALVFIVPYRYFPEEKGKVLGIISSTMAFSAGIGPVIGGFITGLVGWQFLFLISALVAIAIPFFQIWMPDDTTKKGKVDVLGAFFAGGTVASLILFITLLVWWYLLISIVFFSVFTWRIFHSENPFIRPDLFDNVPFRTTIIASFFALMAMFGFMFIMPLMLNEVNGLNSLFIGLTLFPGAMAAAYSGKWAGVFTDKHGAKKVVYLAFSLLIIGYFLLSIFIGSTPWFISMIIIISYIAFPFFQTATASLLSEVLIKEEIGIGMGIYNLFNFIAGAFGGAIIGKSLDYESNYLLNQLSIAQGTGIMYSNIFLALVILTAMNFCFFYFSLKKHGFHSNA